MSIQSQMGTVSFYCCLNDYKKGQTDHCSLILLHSIYIHRLCLGLCMLLWLNLQNSFTFNLMFLNIHNLPNHSPLGRKLSTLGFCLIFSEGQGREIGSKSLEPFVSSGRVKGIYYSPFQKHPNQAFLGNVTRKPAECETCTEHE